MRASPLLVRGVKTPRRFISIPLVPKGICYALVVHFNNGTAQDKGLVPKGIHFDIRIYAHQDRDWGLGDWEICKL